MQKEQKQRKEQQISEIDKKIIHHLDNSRVKTKCEEATLIYKLKLKDIE